MPKIISDISTPAVLIEKSIMEKNLIAMQKLADRNGINLRVHIKSHKIPQLAKRQLKLGAVGIAVAKLGEAETMADAGLNDIQIANIIVGKDKIASLVKLSRRVNLTIAADSVTNIKELSSAFRNEQKPIEILIKINTGLNRCGLDSFPRLLRLLKVTERLKGIRVLGLMTHAGHAYAAKNKTELIKIGTYESTLLIDYANRLKKAGYEIKTISVGSTPTAPYCSKIKGITELRVGNYIFNDMTQVALGVAPISRCALSILATVISKSESGRVIIDTGSKALALDKGAHGNNILNGFGKVVGSHDWITRLSEEHGIIDKPRRKYEVGQKIRIIPNHACTAINLFDKAYLVDGNRIINWFKIAARGKMN
jgi:D-serine deaminase-like pyridoxal phosphate-dependent protein